MPHSSARLAIAILLAIPLLAQKPNIIRGPHPRLYLNQTRIAEMKGGLATTYAAIWPPLLQRAAEIATTHPPAYKAKPDISGNEQWWEMTVGSNMPFLALAYVITGKPVYRDSAKEWALASCSYPHWGLGYSDGGDLAAAYQLLGVSVVYDWLYNDLDAATRATLRQTLIDRTRLMYRQSKLQYWREWYLQNHQWVAMAGLAAGASAIGDDPEVAGESPAWVTLCLEKFRKTESLLGPDGASHEGLTYWSLGLDGLLRFWALASDVMGENVSSPWWANTGYYRLYLSLPRNSWTVADKVVDFGDCTRRDWVGPDYLLRRLAAMYHDEHIQWLAKETASVSDCALFGTCWLNMVWNDPTLPAKPPSSLPTFRHFADMGIVSARSDWSGDESLVAFKCGPSLGHSAIDKLDFDAGGGHPHPDANHFVVFGNGEWLIRDDGYRFKGTDDHNTLLIDGKGQLGENELAMVAGHALGKVGEWFVSDEQIKLKSHPRITAAAGGPVFDYMVGDATQAYPKELGLSRFVRRMVYLKPNILIVADDIVTDRPRSLELRFHPQLPATKDPSGDYLSLGQKAALRLVPFTTDGVEVVAADMPARDLLRPALAEGLDKLERDPRKLFTLQFKTESAAWRNAVALTWTKADVQPPKVTLEKMPTAWVFRTGNQTVTIHWDKSPPTSP